MLFATITSPTSYDGVNLRPHYNNQVSLLHSLVLSPCRRRESLRRNCDN